MDTEFFTVFHPFASHTPFETWIIPKRRQPSFGNITPEELADLSHVLKSVLLKLYRGLNNPDYNYVINSAPVDDENKDYYSWHIRVIPRLTELVGFEIGSGINLNTALPEETAKFMREL
jgi:UDPglucose--hexose-1-phosphate uridylyltransferase